MGNMDFSQGWNPTEKFDLESSQNQLRRLEDDIKELLAELKDMKKILTEDEVHPDTLTITKSVSSHNHLLSSQETKPKPEEKSVSDTRLRMTSTQSNINDYKKDTQSVSLRRWRLTNSLRIVVNKDEDDHPARQQACDNMPLPVSNAVPPLPPVDILSDGSMAGISDISDEYYSDF